MKNDSLSESKSDEDYKIFNTFPQSLLLVGSNRTMTTPDEEDDFEVYNMNQNAEWILPSQLVLIQ